MPKEMMKIIHVTETLKKVFEIYGYEPLETPAFESLDVLKAKCGDEVEKMIYKFKDKKGRDLGLRFDLTVPLARIIAGNPTIPKPFRRYVISKVWRYERPEAKRRFREFMQADLDIVGSDKLRCEVEVLATACDCLKALEIQNFYIKLNSRKILEALANLVGIPPLRHLEVFRIIDKLGKIGLKGVRTELREKLGDESSEAIEKLLKFISEKETHFFKMFNKDESAIELQRLEEGLNELEQIKTIAESYGISEKIIIDLSLARGLDYYTGPIFEILVEKGEDFGSIAGGGRYDDLIELFGGARTPATGISFGIDRIVKLMEREGLFKLPNTNTAVFVAPVNDDMKDEAIKIAQMLRKKGIPTEIEIMGRKLKRQLEHTDRKGIAYTVIVGEKELSKGYIVLRNMRDNTQKLVKISNLPQYFTS